MLCEVQKFMHDGQAIEVFISRSSTGSWSVNDNIR